MPSSEKKTQKGFSIKIKKKKEKKGRVQNIPFTQDAGRQRDSYFFAVQLWLLIEWGHVRNHESEPAELQKGSTIRGNIIFFVHGNMHGMDADKHKHNGQKLPHHQPNKEIR